MSKQPGHERYRTMRQVGLLGTIPMIMAAYPTAGFFFGRWLDGKFGTAPILSLVLIVGGALAAVRDIVRLIRRANALTDDELGDEEDRD